MKHKTFLTTLLLFLLTINFGVSVIAIHTYRETLAQERKHAASEHYLIASGLIKDFAVLDERAADYKQGVIRLVQPYAYLAGNQNAGIALYEADHLLYANIQGGNLAAIPVAENEERRVILMGRGEEAAIFVSGRFPKPYNDYVLLYRSSISDSIQGWQNMKNTMFGVGLVLSGILTVCLLLLLEKLFLPLTAISKISRRIAQGEYSTRLQVKGEDELAEMAKNFNHMADEVERQMKELVITAENKQLFIDHFAHELKTPLTAIYGYAEYLQKAAISEEDARFATACILSESSRIQTMAYQLMELANLRNAQIHMEVLPVSELLLKVKRVLLPKASQKPVALEFHSELSKLYGDTNLLESLLINLIDNAVKASEPGSSVMIRVFTESDIPVITVVDHGRGIPAEALSRVTEPYYRVQQHRSRRDGGAGLGLAICKQIVARHDAQLSFESNPGKGTTVKIHFYNLIAT